MIKKTIHKSHEIRDFSDYRSHPETGNQRLYGVRQCIDCEAEALIHPAGGWTDPDLFKECQS